MGGFGGEVTARTPDEAWATFSTEVLPQIESRFGLFLESPLTRDEAFRTMRQDPTSKYWILDYYFSK
jgi:hypothetical protein